MGHYLFGLVWFVSIMPRSLFLFKGNQVSCLNVRAWVCLVYALLCLIMFCLYWLVLSMLWYPLIVSAFCHVWLGVLYGYVNALVVFLWHVQHCQTLAYSAHHIYLILAVTSLTTYWCCMDWMGHSALAAHNASVCHLYALYIFVYVCLLYSSVVLGNIYLNMLNSIKLPSLGVHILYGILHILCLLIVSNLMIITDSTVLKLSDLTVTGSIFCSLVCVCLTFPFQIFVLLYVKYYSSSHVCIQLCAPLLLGTSTFIHEAV